VSAGLFKAPTKNYWSTSLNGAIDDDDTTITLNSTTNLQSPGYLVINREDSSGTATSTAREVIKFTGIDGSDITGVTRGADNSTARSHADGSLVEAVYTVGMHNDQRDAINAEHGTDGTHSLIASATITAANIAGLRGANASITNIYANTITANSDIAGVGGQFMWTRSGALATVQAATASDTHFPLMRVTKNLTVNSFYASLISAPSLAVFLMDISHGSSPTGDFSSIFSSVGQIDIGEYDTSSCASPAIISLTSLASGSLLRAEIDSHGSAGGLGAILQVTSR